MVETGGSWEKTVLRVGCAEGSPDADERLFFHCASYKQSHLMGRIISVVEAIVSCARSSTDLRKFLVLPPILS